MIDDQATTPTRNQSTSRCPSKSPSKHWRLSTTTIDHKLTTIQHGRSSTTPVGRTTVSIIIERPSCAANDQWTPEANAREWLWPDTAYTYFSGLPRWSPSAHILRLFPVTCSHDNEIQLSGESWGCVCIS